MTTAPGVYVTTSARKAPTGRTAPVAAQAFLAQFHPYGTDAIRAVGAGDLGGRTDQINQRIGTILFAQPPGRIAADVNAIRAFYEEGGQTIYMRRLVGTAVAASLTLAADGDPGLTLNARHVGAYANSIVVSVTAGTDTGHKLTVIDDAGIGVLSATGTTIETIVLDNLADCAAAATAIAANPILNGELIAVVAGGQAATALDNVSPTNLAGGTDDYAPARVAFPPELGPGAILYDLTAEWWSDTSYAAGLLTGLALEAEAGRRIVIAAAPITAGQDPTEVAAAIAAAKASMVADLGADRADELLGYIDLVGVNVIIPSTLGPVAAAAHGFVAGVRARTIADIGPHQAPAGVPSIARWARAVTLDVEGTLNPIPDAIDDPVATELATAGVNAIRLIAGTVRNYGWRSLADSADWRTLTARDTVNAIAAEADNRAEAIAFRPIDGKGIIFADLNAILVGVGQDFAQAGALYPDINDAGDEVDPGYVADTGPTVNTPETIAAEQVNGNLGVRVVPTGAIVNIGVTKATVGTPL